MIQDSPDMIGLNNGEVTGEPHSNAHPQLLDDLVKLLEGEQRK
jgi:hypothetical protein